MQVEQQFSILCFPLHGAGPLGCYAQTQVYGTGTQWVRLRGYVFMESGRYESDEMGKVEHWNR